MEKLLPLGILNAVVDLTTTEVCGMVVGGVSALDARGTTILGTCGGQGAVCRT